MSLPKLVLLVMLSACVEDVVDINTPQDCCWLLPRTDDVTACFGDWVETNYPGQCWEMTCDPWRITVEYCAAE